MSLQRAVQPWRALGLTDAEYEHAQAVLNRTPNEIELQMLAVLWSEHCSYKHSRPFLQQLPTAGAAVLVGPGQNAGVLDVGHGLVVAAKVESHNHPSAVEPYQGAATGVGGILRDILAMGARPVAFLDSLHFGKPGDQTADYIRRQVVAGIAGYGNAIGVPTVGGETLFDAAYAKSPLVNVMCVGLAETQDLMVGVATGDGRPLFLLGPATGRDGIHGATFASAELDRHSEQRRPSVQVGDPFLGKLMIEATLELMASGGVVACQDLGAAGLTSAAAEMADRAGSGIRIDLQAIPRREAQMSPHEVMLSESQERMLFVLQNNAVDTALGICEHWGIPGCVIGQVTSDGLLRLMDHDQSLASLPVALLTHAPIQPVHPGELPEPEQVAYHALPQPDDLSAVLLRLLSDPDLCDKQPIYSRYDYQVGTRTVVGPGADAAVLALPHGGGLALCLDEGGRYGRLDPYYGAMQAVCEAVRNISAVGARPLGLTNCLNLPNPEKPLGARQLERVTAGLRDACLALDVPVIGGNVSLYNESEDGPIPPTPVIGMIGLLDDLALRMTAGFKQAGEEIVLLGKLDAELGGSLYLALVHGLAAGALPHLDPEQERRTADLVRELISSRLITACHDVSAGGLAVALFQMAVHGQDGARGACVRLPAIARPDAVLFGETQGRFLITLPSSQLSSVHDLCRERRIACSHLGQVDPSRLRCSVDTRLVLDETTARLAQSWAQGLRD